MKSFNHIVCSCLFISMASISGFSQETRPVQEDSKTESPKTTGLRKIASGSGLQDLEIEVNVDEEALEASIEVAIEEAMQAMESMEVLERIDIHLEPIEINLEELDIQVEPIVINIPDIDVDIEPIEIDLDDLNIEDEEDDDDHDRYEENDNDNDGDDQADDDLDKSKNKSRDKADKSDKDKEKSKGLKKIN